MDEKYLGSDFDDFLAGEGILTKVETVAIERVIIYRIKQLTNKQDFSKNDWRENA